jgi:hypothetical protein
MGNKLTQEQAQILLLKAYDEKRTFPSLRLGQAIMNLMTLRQMSTVIGSDRDFYNWKDEEKVLECFYQYCVDATSEVKSNED